MKKNEESEVCMGEIVDDPKPISPPQAVQITALEKKEKRMDKKVNWIDTLALFGGGILKFLSLLSENKSSGSSGTAGKSEPSPGRRIRRHGRRS